MTAPPAAARRHGRSAALAARARRGVQVFLARRGVLLSRIDSEGLRYLVPSHDDAVPLPAEAAGELRADHPRLAELRRAYARAESPAATPTQWSEGFLARNLDLAWFRGDNAYVWQLRTHRDSVRARTYLALLDIESRDRLGLLKTLREDGLFGAYTFTFGDRGPVSRDLLDSVNEISYLDEQIGLSQVDELSVLDIGAGYGRLAYRMTEALPNLARYDCTDAVAGSTFLCDFYTRFRRVDDKVRVVPLPDVDHLAGSYTVAVNVHSFSECSLAAIRWWLDLLAERDVPWLLVLPNTPGELLSTEADGSRADFLPAVLDAGFELADRRPVYGSDEMRDLIGVHDEFVLFRRA